MKKQMLFLLMVGLLAGCSNASEPYVPKAEPVAKEGESVAYFASGCFWCVEEIFESLIGVREAVSGYAGGDEVNPSYKQVSAGLTGHAEAVQVFYDPSKVSFETLVDVFFASHDPTTPNRQGPDRGAQYRSVAFYTSPAEKTTIENAIATFEKNGTYDNIVTEVTAFEKFWPAEDYHQDFVRRNPNQGYVQAISVPRFLAFKRNFDPKVFKEGME